MAVSTPGNGAQDPGETKLMAEINVTPMVDVMLVLLVIFMVTAPLLVAGMPVELPKTTAQPIPQTKKPVVVTLALDRSLSIRDERVDAALRWFPVWLRSGPLRGMRLFTSAPTRRLLMGM